MALRDFYTLRSPAGYPISLAVSQQGEIYAGCSDGSIIALRNDSETPKVFVKGASSPPNSLKQRTPRSDFKFVKPIAIDAWGSEYSQYVGDGDMNRVFEISGDVVSLVAGTGEFGRKDGDGLTEAKFDSIHSIAVLPQFIVVLQKFSLGSAVRLIDRATNRVSTLSNFSNVINAFCVLNDSQGAHPNAVSIADKWSTHILPTSGSAIAQSNDQRVCIFQSADRTIEANPIQNSSSVSITSSLDGNPLPTRVLPISWIRDFLPVYSERSDSLFIIHDGDFCVLPNFLGRKEPTRPTTIEFGDATILLGCGLTSDLEFTHEESNTTFKLFQSVIDREMRDNLNPASERLDRFVTSSKLPVALITRFIEHLYFKPLGGLGPQLLIALAWISNEVFGEEDPIIIKALQDRIENESNAIVHNLLISSWTNRFGYFEIDETSLIFATLLPRVQQDRPGFKLAFDTSIAKQASSLHYTISRMTSLLILVSGPSLTVTIPEIKLVLRERFSPSLANTSGLLSLYSTNFVIQLGSYAIGACGWLLYIHWPWFKRLIDSGLQETKTRIVTLPSNSFTRLAAYAIIYMLQLGSMDSLQHLPLKDAISILEHASEFNLIDEYGAALLRVAPLIEICEAKAYPLLSPLNCWDQLRLAYSTGSSRCQSILNFIVNTIDKVALNDLGNLPEELGFELIRKLNAKQKAYSHVANG